MASSLTPSRYRIASKLGEGGMGEVFRLEDAKLARSVAMKRMNEHSAASDTNRRRFEAEFKLMSQLDHPGVVPVFDAGADSAGRDYYLMKEIRGQTLRALLDARPEQSRPDLDDILGLMDPFMRVCETIAYAHSKEVVHRDIKPSNIMLDDFGAVYVLDWGIAKQGQGVSPKSEPESAPEAGEGAKGLTLAGAVLGTPGYMAPEQAFGYTSQATARSDVFALGLTLYEILTNERAYRQLTEDESAVARFGRPPRPARALNSSVPRTLNAICAKAMEQEPGQRYADAAQLLDDLRAFREFRPISARAPRWFERIGLWAQRKPRNAGLAAGVLLTTLVAATAIGEEIVEQQVRIDRASLTVMGVEERVRELEAATRGVATSPERLAELVVEREAYIRGLIALSALGDEPFDETFMLRYREQSLKLLDDLARGERKVEVKAWARKLLSQHDRFELFDAGELARLSDLTQ